MENIEMNVLIFIVLCVFAYKILTDNKYKGN